MDFLKSLMWLSGQAVPIAFHWVALLFFAAFLVLGFTRQSYKSKRATFSWLPFFFVFFSASVLVLGTMFMYVPPDNQPWLRNTSKLPLILVNCVLFVQLVASGLAVYKLKDSRWTSLVLVIFFLWVSFWAWFVAGMSISGDWL